VEKKVEVPVQIIREVPVEVVKECTQPCCQQQCQPQPQPQPPPWGCQYVEMPQCAPCAPPMMAGYPPVEPVRVLEDRPPTEVVREVPYEVVREIPKEIPIEVARSARDVPYWQRSAQRDDFERILHDRKMARSRDAELSRPYRASDRGFGGSGSYGRQPPPRREPLRSSGAGLLTGGR